jgi:hypothetical protein
MKMRSKSLVFGASYLLGFLVVGAIAIALWPDYVVLGVLFCWFLVFAVSQFFILRCPHCRQPATILPRWRGATPFAGTHCRYCGKEY